VHAYQTRFVKSSLVHLLYMVENHRKTMNLSLDEAPEKNNPQDQACRRVRPPTISGLEIDACPGASAGCEGGSPPWIAWSFLVFSALPTGEVGAGRFRTGVATGSTFGAELVGQHDKPIMHLYDPKFMMSKNYT
jgi:hypothetical protein